jgi:hypothetical protein
MSTNTQSLVDEFDKLLGNKPYCTGTQLIEIGLFGSTAAVTAALKRGTLPSVKISPKRTVVPRSAVLDYFRNNLVSNSMPVGEGI